MRYMRCVVPYCENASSRAASRGLAFHRFPAEPSLRRAWLQALGQEDWQPLPSDGVCCLHFLTSDMCTNIAGQRRLRMGAVPVIKPQIEDTSVNATHENTSLQLSNFEIIYNQTDPHHIKIEYVEKENICTQEQPQSKGISSSWEDTVVDNIKGEKDGTANQDEHRTPDNVEYLPNSHEHILINDIKVERDDEINQEFEHIINSDNVIADIKVEMDHRFNQFGADETTDNIHLSNSQQSSLVNRIKFEEDDTKEQNVEDETNGNDIKFEYNDIIRDSHNDKDIANRDMASQSLHDYTVHVDIKVEEQMTKDQGLSYEEDITSNEIVSLPSVSNYILSHDIKIEEYGIKESPGVDEDEDISIAYKIHSSAFKGDDCGVLPLQASNRLSVATKKEPRPNRTEENRRKPEVERFQLNTKLSCDLCPYTTAHEKQLLSHIKAHAASESFTCGQCYYKTTKSECLRTHMKTHSTQRAFTCDLCSKSFKEKGSIIRHLRIHSGEKRYSCSVCKKAFQEQNDLKNHLRTHSGAKPFPCDVCNKSFSERNNLHRHLRMHSGVKPHSCEVCRKSFLQKHHLKRHLQMHAREQLYCCDLCNREFTRKCSLHHHLKWCAKQQIGDNKFRSIKMSHICHFCKREFSKKRSLHNHLRRCAKGNNVRNNIVKNMKSMRKKQG